MLKVFFDDNCPLCRNTVATIKRFVRPRTAEFIALSEATLSEELNLIATNYMLSIDSKSTNMYQGYDTYIEIFKRSTGRSSGIIKLVSRMMEIGILRAVGRRIYNIVAKNRKRCSTTCTTRIR